MLHFEISKMKEIIGMHSLSIPIDKRRKLEEDLKRKEQFLY